MTRIRRRRRAQSSGVWSGAASGVGFMLLLAVLALALAVAVVPRVMNGVPLTVLTGSMEPTYAPGDMVVSVPQESYAIGDVVTFQPVSGDPTLVTHRVVGISQRPDSVEYITQGDANGAEDAPIVAEQVMGKVLYHVPYVGHVANSLGRHGETVLLVAGGGLLLYGVYSVASGLIGQRRSKHARTPAPTAVQT